MKLATAVMCTTGATALMLAHAAHTRDFQFFPVVMHLTHSKGCMLILAAQALMMVLLVGLLVKRLFLGELQDAEVVRCVPSLCVLAVR